MSKKKRPKKKYKPKARHFDYITVQDVEGIKVTDDPIDIPGKTKFREGDEDLYSQTHDCIRTDPQTSVSIIMRLLEIYPDHPTLLTNLSAAYSVLGKHEEAFAVAKKNYEKNYFYPFAGISYAQSLIFQEKYLEIPKIFDYHLMINRAFPDRGLFHESEVVGFSHVMLHYHIHHSDYEEACLHRRILKTLNEESNISSLQMFLTKLQSKLKNKPTPARIRH